MLQSGDIMVNLRVTVTLIMHSEYHLENNRVLQDINCHICTLMCSKLSPERIHN